MKLSRLSNRQLRRLLAQGEVRFASDEKIVKKALGDWADGVLEALVKTYKLPGTNHPLDKILKKEYPAIYRKYADIQNKTFTLLKQLLNVD